MLSSLLTPRMTAALRMRRSGVQYVLSTSLPLHSEDSQTIQTTLLRMRIFIPRASQVDAMPCHAMLCHAPLVSRSFWFPASALDACKSWFSPQVLDLNTPTTGLEHYSSTLPTASGSPFEGPTQLEKGNQTFGRQRQEATRRGSSLICNLGCLVLVLFSRSSSVERGADEGKRIFLYRRN